MCKIPIQFVHMALAIHYNNIIFLHMKYHTIQGMISFYMMCTGEEACHFGSAVGLDNEDMVYAQYREAGVLMWRGFTVDQCMHQCFSTREDLGRGRQMPVHYGSKDHNYQFISSCLATQMPQGEIYYTVEPFTPEMRKPPLIGTH